MAPRKRVKAATIQGGEMEAGPSFLLPPPPRQNSTSEDPQVRIDHLEEENRHAQEQLWKVQDQWEKLQQMVHKDITGENPHQSERAHPRREKTISLGNKNLASSKRRETEASGENDPRVPRLDRRSKGKRPMETRVQNARSETWDDPTSQIPSQKTPVRDRLRYPEDHPMYQEHHGGQGLVTRKEPEVNRAHSGRERSRKIIDLASEAVSTRGNLRGSRRQRRKQHLVDLHRVDSEVDQRIAQPTDMHRADSEVGRRIALLEQSLNPPRGNTDMAGAGGYHPFTREIRSAPAPVRFRQPTLDKYEGKTDPVEHLSHFNAMVGLFGYEDAASFFQFKASNNEAEYEALISGVRAAYSAGARNIEIYIDSQLVVSQVNGEYEAREPDMVRFLEKAKTAQPNSLIS